MADREFSWRRSLAWFVALLLHAAILVPLSVPALRNDRERTLPSAELPRWVDVERVTPVELPVPTPPSVETVPEAEREIAPVARAAARRPRLRISEPQAPAKPRASGERPAGSSSAPSAPVARTIVYLDDDARALLPYENLYSATPPAREGDYYTPGDGSEDDVFYRPRALDPDPSRFAYAWRPRGTLIDDWLGQLVEKTTGQISVPLNAKFALVCKASIAGMGGGCAIVRNGGTGVIVERPPPAPWEQSNRVQCRELRQALENAEEARQVAYFIDRLSALCSAADGATEQAPDTPAGNDEARREAGLPEDQRASGDADAQRLL